MPPVAFTDEELDAISALASALPRNLRGEFLQRIADKLANHPERGAGLVYRLAIEAQRPLLHDRLVAVGVSKPGKYGRSPRRERRR